MNLVLVDNVGMENRDASRDEVDNVDNVVADNQNNSKGGEGLSDPEI